MAHTSKCKVWCATDLSRAFLSFQKTKRDVIAQKNVLSKIVEKSCTVLTRTYEDL
jgi:hypothetical protein